MARYVPSRKKNNASERSIWFIFLWRYRTCGKYHIGTSCESGMSVGNTWSIDFCVNEFDRTCLKLRSSKFEVKFIAFNKNLCSYVFPAHGSWARSPIWYFPQGPYSHITYKSNRIIQHWCTMWTSCCFDADLTLAEWTYFCGWFCWFFFWFSDCHQFVYRL